MSRNACSGPDGIVQECGRSNFDMKNRCRKERRERRCRDDDRRFRLKRASNNYKYRDEPGPAAKPDASATAPAVTPQPTPAAAASRSRSAQRRFRARMWSSTRRPLAVSAMRPPSRARWPDATRRSTFRQFDDRGRPKRWAMAPRRCLPQAAGPSPALRRQLPMARAAASSTMPWPFARSADRKFSGFLWRTVRMPEPAAMRAGADAGIIAVAPVGEVVAAFLRRAGRGC